MTDDMVQAGDTDGPRGRVPYRWVVVVTIALLLVGAALGARWFTGLALLQAYPIGGETGPLELGHTVYADLGLSTMTTTDDNSTDPSWSSVPVTVSAIVPRVGSNTSGATIRVLVCQRNGGQLGIGLQETGLSDSCTSVTDFTTPMTLSLGFPTTQILVAVTARRPGAVHIEGVDISYSQGLRRATQQSGTDLTLTTP